MFQVDVEHLYQSMGPYRSFVGTLATIHLHNVDSNLSQKLALLGFQKEVLGHFTRLEREKVDVEQLSNILIFLLEKYV